MAKGIVVKLRVRNKVFFCCLVWVLVCVIYRGFYLEINKFLLRFIVM